MNRRKSLLDYAGTIGITMLTSGSMLVVVAVLARYLDRAEFTEYSVVTRYLGLLVALCNLGLGFAFIRHATAADRARATQVAGTARRMMRGSLTLAFVCWSLALAALHARGVGDIDWLLPLVFVWVVSQTSFSLSNPYSRFVGGIGEYARLYLGAKILPLLVAAACASFVGRFEVFFIVHGVLCIAYQAYLWRGVEIPAYRTVDRALAASLLRFSGSRWLEGLLRISFPVVLISATGWFLGAATAGGIAVVYLVAKSMESVLQPLVIAIMMRSAARGDSVRGVRSAIALAVVVTLAVFLARPLVETLFSLYLGAKYTDLVPEAWTVLLAAGSLIALNYLKALNDIRLRVSPMLTVNLVTLVLLPIGVALCRSLGDVAILVTLLHVNRFALYVLILARSGANRFESDAVDAVEGPAST